MRSSFEVGRHFQIHVVLQNAVNFNESSKQSACMSSKYPYEGTPNDLHFYIPFHLKAFTFTSAIVIPEMAFRGILAGPLKTSV